MITPHCIAALWKNRVVASQCKHCGTTHPHADVPPRKIPSSSQERLH